MCVYACVCVYACMYVCMSLSLSLSLSLSVCVYVRVCNIICGMFSRGLAALPSSWLLAAYVTHARTRMMASKLAVLACVRTKAQWCVDALTWCLSTSALRLAPFRTVPGRTRARSYQSLNQQQRWVAARG